MTKQSAAEFHLTAGTPQAGDETTEEQCNVYNAALDILAGHYGEMDQQTANDFFGASYWADDNMTPERAAQMWLDGMR